MKVPHTKIVRCVLSSILLLFAGLQLNDPDPWRWVLLYGFTFVLGVMGSSVQNPLRVGVSILYVVGLLAISDGVSRGWSHG